MAAFGPPPGLPAAIGKIMENSNSVVVGGHCVAGCLPSSTKRGNSAGSTSTLVPSLTHRSFMELEG
jgi:hypothetical protein